MPGNGKPAQLTGKRFGFLTVLQRAGRDGKRTTWRVRCSCGHEFVVRGDKLKGGRASCGRGNCNRARIYIVAPDEWRVWKGMLQRCDPIKGSPRYGGRGIRVCKRWRDDFQCFLADMGPRPSPEHSIDRFPNMDGNYEPTNCRWATRKQQGRNKSTTVFVEYEGERLPVMTLVDQFKINRRMLVRRLERGWTIDEALTIPAKKLWINVKRYGPS